MTDWPRAGSPLAELASGGILSTFGSNSPAGQYGNAFHTGAASSSTWPSANLALYYPLLVADRCTVYHMGIQVGTQAGNVDVGIYDEALNLKVSAGSTAVAAAGVQTFNIADTVLTPGLYYLAMACSSATAAFVRMPHQGVEMRMFGAAQQALGALPLGSIATFAALAQNYLPALCAYTRSVTP